MRISDLSGWHGFVYSQLYPAVLGSMLYDLLHVSNNWNIQGFLKLALTGFYVLDYFNIHSVLKSDDFEKRNGPDLWIDGLVAVCLGVSYWFLTDTQYVIAYALIAVVTLLFILYYCRGDRKTVKNIVSMTALFIFASLAAYSHSRGFEETWLKAVLALLPTIAYASFVFWASDKKVQAQRS